MSDGDDGDDDFDGDDDGGGYGSVRYLRRGNRGPAVRSLQSRLSALGFPCRIDGIFGSETEAAVRRFQSAAGISVDGKAGNDTFRMLAEAEHRRVSTATYGTGANAPSVSASANSAGGSGAGATASLLGFALVVALLYWFVTVVLPVLLAIAAALAALAVLVVVLRFCARTFGWAATLKGLAVAVVVPSLIAAYVAHFTGDFEAAGSGVIGRTEPRSSSEPCGEAVSEGDNLSFVGSSRPENTLEARWARVRIRDASCWVPFSRLRFQRGVFMTLISKVGHLSTTTDEDRSARLQLLEALDRETADLYAAGAWQSLAALGQRLRADGQAVSDVVALRVEEADARQTYERLLAAYERAPDAARESVYRRALDLRAPVDHSALTDRRSTWIATRCREILTSIDAGRESLDVRVRRWVSIAPMCSSRVAARTLSSAEALARALAAAPDQSPRIQVESLAELARAAPTSELIQQALAAATVAARSVEVAQGTECVGARAEQCLAARCANTDVSWPSISASRMRALPRAAEAHARAAANSLLEALAVRHTDAFRAALALAPFGVSNESLPAAVLDDPRGWRVDRTTVDSCARRARLAITQRRRAGRAAQGAELSFCFHQYVPSWFVCGSTSREVP